MLHLMTSRTMISVAVAGACAVCAQTVWAQQSDAEVPPAAVAETARPAGEALQEVTVSATRHSSALLKTPLAVSAVTQESLTRAGITDVRGLSGAVPNLQLSTAVDSGVQIAIRGISTKNFTEASDPSVGLHVAGLYSPRPQGALALLFDLDQVEVLRGPQGTLFGRNSTGGSINIIPAKPEFGSTYGSSVLDVGSYRKRQLNVVQNIAISDSLALRGTFMKLKRDGWINQMQDFTDVNIPSRGFIADGIPDVDQRFNSKVDPSDYYTNKNEWAGRLSARWKAARDVEWLVAYERYQNSGAGNLFIKDCDQAAGTRFACPGSQWDVKINLPGKIDMSINTLRSNLIWDLNPNNRIEYSLAHAIQKRSQQTDDDAGYHPLASQVDVKLPVPAGGNGSTWPVLDTNSRTLDSKYVSDVHELQLKQNYDAFQTVYGGFYMKEKNQINYAQEFLAMAPYGYPISQYYNQPDVQVIAKALYAQTDWKFAPQWTATFGGRYSWDTKINNNGKVFGGDWDPSKPAYYNGQFNPGVPGTPGFAAHNGTQLTPGMGPLAGTGAYALYGPPAVNTNEQSWKHFTYRLGLMAQLTPSDMVYSSLSTGYKSGGFSDQDDACGGKTCVDGPAGPHITFFPWGPETVTNLELGYKGRFLENRLNLSATLFYSRYKDKQEYGQFFSALVKTDAPCPATNPTCNVIIKGMTKNVGVVDIPGLELELDYKPWRGARLGASFAYINSKMRDYPTYSDNYGCGYRAEFGAVPCPPMYSGSDPTLVGKQIYDITGNHLTFSPKYTMSLNFSQNINLPNDYVLVPWLSVKWQDKMYFSLRNLDNPHMSDAQKAYSTVDGSLKLIGPHNWYAELYGLNLTDTRSKNAANFYSGFGANNAGGFVRASWNDPRTVGLRIGVSY
ncbi:TonB-dependent receptor [Pseudoduganella sp. FT93W]|uniref:TonB-dependent receptor n=2 Tax=Duganella fentianensis TaxID=2692177 RepID=A0A845I765_9BURK|nr:TonB-dependent receptor [Duganella fentianensis]